MPRKCRVEDADQKERERDDMIETFKKVNGFNKVKDDWVSVPKIHDSELKPDSVKNQRTSLLSDL